MDLVGACAAFVAVGEHGSFTVGAEAARTSQSGASRRVAALEAHLGIQLLVRTSKHVSLTRAGQDVLPLARRLVGTATELERRAAQGAGSTLRIALPETTAPRDVAGLVLAGRRHGVDIEVVHGPPSDRAGAVTQREVGAAVLPVGVDQARWLVPLGVAGGSGVQGRTFRLESLRPGRGATRTARRIWITAEDDLPRLGDDLSRRAAASGVLAGQVGVRQSFVVAAALALSSSDLVLCSAQQAVDADLAWTPLAGEPSCRAYAAASDRRDHRVLLEENLHEAVAAYLGAAPGGIA